MSRKKGTTKKVSKPAVDKKGTTKKDTNTKSKTASKGRKQKASSKSASDNIWEKCGADFESRFSVAEDEDDSNPNILLRRTTMGNGPPDEYLTELLWMFLCLANSILLYEMGYSSWQKNYGGNRYTITSLVWSFKSFNLSGLSIFEELLEVDFLSKSCSRAMKAVGVVEAACEEVFELVMSMDATRFEGQQGQLITMFYLIWLAFQLMICKNSFILCPMFAPVRYARLAATQVAQKSLMLDVLLLKCDRTNGTLVYK